MSTSTCISFERRPSALSFMLNALRPSKGLGRDGGFPQIVARWRGHEADPSQLHDFLRLTGLPKGDYLPLIYPHVFAFRLQMVVLTHPVFPLPIWGALQIRNHLLQHRPIPSDGRMDIETRVAGWRILEKGAEVDLHTTVIHGGALAWESLNTFYYRGRFGTAAAAPPLSATPDVPSTEIAAWRLPPGVGWRLARMTGDYNGIHRWDWYARRFGFPRAFFHPQMIVGQCMARVAADNADQSRRLDLWIRGPVYFDSDVSLRAASSQDSTVFALMLRGDDRPAILGRLRAAAGTQPLLGEATP
ncbi:MAG: acyl dehydratase [Hyphomicrobiaceae bacterium]|nr:MAG: acyl dehydratase [Hyphomicrobiaceae bacterium]